MLGTHDLALFIASGLLLNATPGADTLFITTRSATQGFRAGVVAALGINAGCLVHVLAAALGLSAILSTSATAFWMVKLLGAAYLIYMGVTMLWQRPAAPNDPAAPRATSTPSLPRVFAQGLLTNALNPKVALFFLAFVPQFIDTDAASKPLAFLFLGALFVLNSTWWCMLLAWLGARARRLQIQRQYTQWLTRGVGALFVLLGVRLALSDQT